MYHAREMITYTYEYFLWGNLNRRNHFEDLGVDGRIILTYILKKREEACRLDSYRVGQGLRASSYDFCNAILSSMKGW
jgi:hypothetical protein